VLLPTAEGEGEGEVLEENRLMTTGDNVGVLLARSLLLPKDELIAAGKLVVVDEVDMAVEEVYLAVDEEGRGEDDLLIEEEDPDEEDLAVDENDIAVVEEDLIADDTVSHLP